MDTPSDGGYDLTEDELEELELEAMRLRAGLARHVYVKDVLDVATGEYL